MSCCRAGAVAVAFERLEARALFAVGPLDVGIGTGAARSVRFVDADGTAVSVSMNVGAATVHFAGDGLAQAAAGRDIAVSGAGITVSGITATGTTRRSSLSISTSGGDGRVSVGGVSADGPLKRVTAAGAVLTGPVATGGAVRQFQVLRAENTTVSLGGGPGSSSIEITEGAANVALTSAAPVRHLALGSWAGGSITAPSIGTATISNTFTGAITAGSAGSLSFSRLQNAAVNITGPLRRIAADDAAADSVIDIGGNVGEILLDVMERCRVYVGVRPLPPESQMPTTTADFAAPAIVGRVIFGSFATFDTVVAAPFIRKLFIGMIADIATGGFNPHTFVAADRVTDFRGTLYNLSSQRPFHYKNLDHEVRQLGVVELTAL